MKEAGVVKFNIFGDRLKKSDYLGLEIVINISNSVQSLTASQCGRGGVAASQLKRGEATKIFITFLKGAIGQMISAKASLAQYRVLLCAKEVLNGANCERNKEHAHLLRKLAGLG